ncbi:hypothetical protein HanXRQr2_Chr12g0537831 [Helianthus annuus]|uniref:Uncharacterized protein n=1 Tax=Helianthus annuus TaxID=4232 RepID=A0A251T256_HELAN|nr:hypothetical protein HanXRQr2_Chr12g0537831 [Helianthus annuus]KAJ0489132.1 hypothetical protein HanHA300_Chr12g0440501 [Helianthus annuus]KAJ0505010.1 hypothetical protein HanHA89_Chr12g0465611 [Helianthus annuus]KAJ0674693.1 hypothetical protein HanLR1_Chr12g0442731 [Helianthus annuus]KAJ0862393.1 hypothetical protein HanPSC8_Chr12g0517671 [Helianthus annuus]
MHSCLCLYVPVLFWILCGQRDKKHLDFIYYYIIYIINENNLGPRGILWCCFLSLVWAGKWMGHIYLYVGRDAVPIPGFDPSIKTT